MKKCEHCGNTFKPYRDWQKFCPGTNCKKEHEAQQAAALRELKGENGNKNVAAIALGKRRMRFLTPEQKRELSRLGNEAKQRKKLVTDDERELADTLEAMAKALRSGRIELLHYTPENAGDYQALSMAVRKRVTVGAA